MSFIKNRRSNSTFNKNDKKILKDGYDLSNIKLLQSKNVSNNESPITTTKQNRTFIYLSNHRKIKLTHNH